jgi:hypothetical protein
MSEKERTTLCQSASNFDIPFVAWSCEKHSGSIMVDISLMHLTLSKQDYINSSIEDNTKKSYLTSQYQPHLLSYPHSYILKPGGKKYIVN